MIVTDPVCKMTFPAEKAAAEYVYKGTKYYFCNIKCKEKFALSPKLYLSGDAPVESCCCSAGVFEDDELKIKKQQQKLLLGFVIAAAITLVTAFLNYSSWADKRLLDILQFILATLAVFGPGGFLLARGAKSLKGFKFNMFTLITVGILSAYLCSIYVLFINSSSQIHLHFQSACMITALVILGQYLEARASCGATQSIRALLELVPQKAHKFKPCCKSVTDVDISEISVGDFIKVLPHEKIPVDGVVTEGHSWVNESMLTGEALEVEKSVGSFLAAGTINGNTVLFMRATQVGSNTQLAKIIDLVRGARNTRLPIQNLADKISAIFVPLVFLVALLSLLYWGVVAGNWSVGLSNFMAVLLVACPCSLGLAAPLAVTIGVGCGARHGILIKKPEALEKLRKVDTLMLDKTGTLTENTLKINNVVIADGVEENLFYRALFALEVNSNHPFSKAVQAMACFDKYADDLPEVEDFTSIQGQGVCGIVDDIRFVLGNCKFMQAEFMDTEAFYAQCNVNIAKLADSVLFLGANRRIWGMITANDIIRQDALEVITALKNKQLEPVIISGDNAANVKNTACALGIEEFYGNLLPQDKLEKVRARQHFGRCVVMVGDGVNDAAALAAADVSVAMGGGSDAAVGNADITLLAGNIGKLAKLMNLSSMVNETIRQNLALAFAYNITLIPLAAGAFYSILHWQFSPVLSSIAMSGSSLLVVANSLRLWYRDLSENSGYNQK